MSDTVTVVVPTFRRPDGIRRALAGLAAVADPGVPWDVVVVDNYGDVRADDLPPVPVPVRVVVEEQRGAAQARNRGLHEAEGSIIVFLDDDVVPDVEWLARLIEPIRSGRSDATGGRVVLDPSVPRPSWFAPWMASYLADFDPHDDEVDIREVDGLMEPYVLTASAAFRADHLREIDGFDPLLGPRSGVPLVNDDLSLCRRFLATGRSLHYVPSAVVVHELPPARLSRRYIARRFYAQGRSDWVLDRDQHEHRRFGGIAGSLVGYVRDCVIGWRELPERPASFMFYEAFRRAGFVAEAARAVRSRER